MRYLTVLSEDMISVEAPPPMGGSYGWLGTFTNMGLGQITKYRRKLQPNLGYYNSVWSINTIYGGSPTHGWVYGWVDGWSHVEFATNSVAVLAIVAVASNRMSPVGHLQHDHIKAGLAVQTKRNCTCTHGCADQIQYSSKCCPDITFSKFIWLPVY